VVVRRPDLQPRDAGLSLDDRSPSCRPLAVDVSDRLEPLMTARELAEMLRVSLSTVRRWTRSGKVPAVRLSNRAIRYRRSDVEAALRYRKGAPPA
jgi:excisionase family DNA binding protein